MTKKIFNKIIPIVLVLCMLMSSTVFAATTYSIDVTLSGPDANGKNQTISLKSSKYGAKTTPLASEIVMLINDDLDNIKTVFAHTGLSQIVYDGLEAFKNGDKSWEAYTNLYFNDVTGDFKAILSDRDSTFGSLTVNKENKISYTTENGMEYIVTVTLRQNGIGEEIENCPHGDSCPNSVFTDLEQDSWYHDGIHYCVTNGLMSGYSQTSFGPIDNLTRSQVAQILYNREDRPAVNVRAIYPDVKTDAWYSNAIIWASEAGVVTGYGNGNFGPEDSITREQLAVMLHRYSAYKGDNVSIDGAFDSSSFSDGASISGWALDAITWAYVKGIIKGTGNNALNPLGLASRSEAATMFMRYCANVAGR